MSALRFALIGQFDSYHGLRVALSRGDDAQFLVSARKAPERAKLTDRCGRDTHPLCYLHLHFIWKIRNRLAQVIYGRQDNVSETWVAAPCSG
jgi:hypothetical protein